jgi:hypothetical protein
MNILEGMLYESRLAADITDYELQCKAAQLLGVSIEDYLDFVRDMEIDTIKYSLEEIEIMYDDYKMQEYVNTISMPTYEDYACIDRMGWD